MKSPASKARGIPRAKGHRSPSAGSPADRVDAKPSKGSQPRQPDYDTTNLRQPLTAGPKRLGKR